MTNLIKHAEKELKLARMYDKDADYGGMLAPHILELIKLFSTEEHSGGSASITLLIFNKLANFENLSPLTNNKEEWTEVAENQWQNKRNGKAFSQDKGITYYLLSDKKKIITSKKV